MKKIIDIHNLPVHQNVVYSCPENAKKCPRGDVVLIQDGDSGLVHNVKFDETKINYNEEYQNEQSHSVFFKKHLNNVLSIVKSNIKENAVIEIGCGKGAFLSLLQDNGYSAIGFDPAYEGNNDKIKKELFTSSSKVKASGIILRHTLEHVSNPFGFLSNIASANNNKGLIYIEVPCFEWIVNNNAWFDIFYEHVNYFRLADLRNMFSRIIDEGALFGGQYIYIVADISSIKKPESAAVESISIPDSFMEGLVKAKKIIMENKKQANVVWGASSKGVIFAHHLLVKGAQIDYLVDINPKKQNKYIPGAGLKIHSPEYANTHLKHGDNIFVMNRNYNEEVKAMTNNNYNYILVDKL